MATSNQKVTEDLFQYAQKHLLDHMYAAGMTNEEVEARIFQIPMNNPYRADFVAQYIVRLPENQREEAAKRLQQSPGSTIKITVLTAEGQPTFEISSATISDASQVDRLVYGTYGLQENGNRHNWRGDLVWWRDFK